MPILPAALCITETTNVETGHLCGKADVECAEANPTSGHILELIAADVEICQVFQLT